MPDMYDKLGEMLNEVLESGEIPHSEQQNNDQDTESEKPADSGHFSFKNDENPVENDKKSADDCVNGVFDRLNHRSRKQIPTGEVIKLHKYTYNMQFPPYIQKALSTLDIAYPFRQKDISRQYHKLLKQNHPDTQNTIHSSQDVQNNSQITVDEIIESYKILCEFFGIK